MATLLQPLTIKAGSGSTIITAQQFRDYINLTIEDNRGILQTVGPWQIPTKFIAPVIVAKFSPLGWAESYTLYGIRTLAECKSGLYNLEGRVSINGKKHSAYTSSILWSVDGKKLIATAVIYARLK